MVIFKKNILLTSIVSICFLLLAGCQEQYRGEAEFVPPLSLSGKACVNTCEDQLQYCQTRTSDASDGCMSAANDRATAKLQEYVEQYGNNIANPKTAADFYDDSDCQQDGPCRSVYNQCFVHCGGVVQQKQVCTKNCKATNSK